MQISTLRGNKLELKQNETSARCTSQILLPYDSPQNHKYSDRELAHTAIKSLICNRSNRKQARREQARREQQEHAGGSKKALCYLELRDYAVIRLLCTHSGHTTNNNHATYIQPERTQQADSVRQPTTAKLPVQPATLIRRGRAEYLLLHW